MPREQPTQEEWEIDAKIAESRVKSWKPEVIADSTGKWCGNALRFETYDEAKKYVEDLAGKVDDGQPDEGDRERVATDVSVG